VPAPWPAVMSGESLYEIPRDRPLSLVPIQLPALPRAGRMAQLHHEQRAGCGARWMLWFDEGSLSHRDRGSMVRRLGSDQRQSVVQPAIGVMVDGKPVNLCCPP